MFTRITESDSHYRHIEQMSVQEVLNNINKEDQKVALAVEACLPEIECFVVAATKKMKLGGRLFYIGAGTSGRLGVLDASECPPTYGVSPNLVIGLIAGGDHALRHPVEDAEDNKNQGWNDLQKHQISNADVVVGIAASGTTPYVIEALRSCQTVQILTACITCNPEAPLTQVADYPMVANVGPEFITGSTRMKSGTAQKLILNMISTALMIQLGKVEDNKMIHMQLKNEKLRDRGIMMLMQKTGLDDYEKAKQLLMKYGSVFEATEHMNTEQKRQSEE